MTSPLHIVWAFSVVPSYQAQFEAAYGPTGDWAQLFGHSNSYLGTHLYRDVASRNDGLLHYLCEDVWQDAAAYDAFKAQHHEAYQALDARCEAWTVLEQRLL